MPTWNRWVWCICSTCECLRQELSGEPDAGNPHVRFDEGGVGCGAGHAANKPQRGNLVTEVCRSLNTVAYSSTLPYSAVSLNPHTLRRDCPVTNPSSLSFPGKLVPCSSASSPTTSASAGQTAWSPLPA